MTYQDTNTQSVSHGLARAIWDAVSGTAYAFGDALIKAGEANSRLNHVRHLQAKTDAELAALNIKRDEIVQHVFADVYYI